MDNISICSMYSSTPILGGLNFKDIENQHLMLHHVSAVLHKGRCVPEGKYHGGISR